MMKRSIALCGALVIVGASCVATAAQEESHTPPAAAAGTAPSGSKSAPASQNKGKPHAAGRPEPMRNEPAKAAAPVAPAAPMAASPAAGQEPAAPRTVREPTGEFQPVVQARSANVTTCMDKIVSMSARVIDRPHASVSTYVQAAPNENVFESIIGMNYPNKEMPNGAAVILAAPVGGTKCQGETVQVYPTTNSCTAVQASLIKNGRTLTSLNSLPLLQTKDGTRDLLIPTAGGGCVVVGIALH